MTKPFHAAQIRVCSKGSSWPTPAGRIAENHTQRIAAYWAAPVSHSQRVPITVVGQERMRLGKEEVRTAVDFDDEKTQFSQKIPAIQSSLRPVMTRSPPNCERRQGREPPMQISVCFSERQKPDKQATHKTSPLLGPSGEDCKPQLFFP